jgi:LDH2 family malate/lactate/ureidoglycolate dehydrogenase
MGVANKYDHRDLTRFATQLLRAAGMPNAKAEAVAETLVSGDLLGKSTHGLALLALYLADIEKGNMALEGEPVVVNEIGACLTWDGRKLPGPWLVRQAVDEAIARAGRCGMGAVAIQRSHHTACLGAYLEQATSRGLMLLITLTDPSFYSVAPFGGIRPVLTSNPIAFGAPTEGEPILIDTSTSLTTNGMAGKHAREGRLFAHPWLLDNQGNPSHDPAVLSSKPPGTILPLGGLEAGQKGYGLGLMVELLTGCLTGRGRADTGDGWSAAVLVLCLDPAAFGGADDYRRQVAYLAEACHASVARDGFDTVSLPGERAQARRRDQTGHGVLLDASIIEALRPWALRWQVEFPCESGSRPGGC